MARPRAARLGCGACVAMAARQERDFFFQQRVVMQQRVGHGGAGDAAGEFAHAFTAGGDGGQYRNGQLLRQCRNIHRYAAGHGFVVHVQGQHHGNAQFSQECGQGQGSAQVLGVPTCTRQRLVSLSKARMVARSSSLREGRASTPGVSSSVALASKRAGA